MTASYAGFLLMGFHIGLHYGMIVGMIKRICPITKKNAVCIWVLRVLAFLIAGYGVHALFTRKFVDYISQRVMFAFFDYEEPVLSFVLDYAAIMGLMIFISYYLQRFLQWIRKTVPKKKENID